MHHINHRPLSPFDRYADRYTAFASIQYDTFTSVLANAPTIPATHILDIGCGTGHNTIRIGARYPTAQIHGIDLSKAMIDQAALIEDPQYRWDVADIVTLTPSDPYQVIISHATLQWVTDLVGYARAIHRLLDSNGHLCLCLFGPQTYHELQDALTQTHPNHPPIAATRFHSRETIEAAFSPYVSSLTIAEDHITRLYPSVRHLFETMKYSGTVPPTRYPWTRGGLHALEAAYPQTEAGVPATYHVLVVSGIKR